MKLKQFKAGDRVYAHGLDSKKYHGTIHKNTEFPNISEWYVKYDDGKECAIIDIDSVFINTKINTL